MPAVEDFRTWVRFPRPPPTRAEKLGGGHPAPSEPSMSDSRTLLLDQDRDPGQDHHGRDLHCFGSGAGGGGVEPPPVVSALAPPSDDASPCGSSARNRS